VKTAFSTESRRIYFVRIIFFQVPFLSNGSSFKGWSDSRFQFHGGVLVPCGPHGYLLIFYAIRISLGQSSPSRLGATFPYGSHCSKCHPYRMAHRPKDWLIRVSHSMVIFVSVGGTRISFDVFMRFEFRLDIPLFRDLAHLFPVGHLKPSPTAL
jgi:hypothetical protein